MCKQPLNALSYDSYSVLDDKKSSKNTCQATTFKVEENSRTFKGLAQKFKDFSRTSFKIQGLFETARTLSKIGLYFTHRNGPIFRVKTDFAALQWFFQLCTDQAKAVGELTQQVREMTSEVGEHNPGR